MTEILALLLIAQNLKLFLGYFLGSIASCINFFFQAKRTEKSLNLPESPARFGAFKNFYLRYLILFGVMIIFVKFLKLNIFSLLVGLVSVPIVVTINSLVEAKKDSK
ncbi:MAG: ATP synthase subunit I [Candidatus Cloacimonetes bacterium]|nr:ATP synthase subunit I [Candidatus Cloacimonadota bacterium]